MLAEARFKQLQEIISTATKDELVWMNGYLSGLLQSGYQAVTPNGTTPAAGVKKISLLYGTETGNAKKLATAFAAVAKKQGHKVKLTAMNQYNAFDLEKEEYLFIVLSTHGEGEPPAAAKSFYDALLARKGALPRIQYSVLALGDTSYPLFCKAGEDVDLQLEELGARRIVPLEKCDLDFDVPAQAWWESVNKVLASTPDTAAPLNPAAEVAAPKSGKKFYAGTIKNNINLNDRGSAKETWHVEIAVAETVDYEPGDALAMIPENRAEAVDKIIALTGIDANLVIETKRFTATVHVLLTKHLNICYLLLPVIQQYAQVTGQDIPAARMDLLDLLRIYPVQDAAQFAEVIKILTPIAPRLYSVSSSPNAHEDEIHITVSRNDFVVQAEQRFGLCSQFIGGLEVGTAVQFYIQKNRRFKLPAPDKNLILIGPGTGIAPMRSFLAERDATGAGGKNWLFFGEQHFVSDFLYQTEMQEYAQTGVLNKVSLAWSRDQPEKIYVQHRMQENADELYNWVKDGAYICISGTKNPMSTDVEKAWLQVIAKGGEMTEEAAAAYWQALKEEGRYLEDVY